MCQNRRIMRGVERVVSVMKDDGHIEKGIEIKDGRYSPDIKRYNREWSGVGGLVGRMALAPTTSALLATTITGC